MLPLPESERRFHPRVERCRSGARRADSDVRRRAWHVIPARGPMKSQSAVIVLAAGKGSRFERRRPQAGPATRAPRRVLGTTLRHAIASHLAGGRRHDRAVRRPGAAQRRGARRRGAARSRQRRCDAARHGLLDRAPASVPGPMRRAGSILPGDMPMVQPATMQAVARQLEHHPVVYAQHKGRRGHPVGFATELYSELVTLSGDEGARRLVARYPAFGLEVDDSGVLVDVDTDGRPRKPAQRVAAPTIVGRAACDPAQAVRAWRRARATRRSTSRSRMPQPRSEAARLHQVVRACCRSGRSRCAGCRPSAHPEPDRCGSGSCDAA